MALAMRCRLTGPLLHLGEPACWGRAGEGAGEGGRGTEPSPPGSALRRRLLSLSFLTCIVTACKGHRGTHRLRGLCLACSPQPPTHPAGLGPELMAQSLRQIQADPGHSRGGSTPFSRAGWCSCPRPPVSALSTRALTPAAAEGLPSTGPACPESIPSSSFQAEGDAGGRCGWTGKEALPERELGGRVQTPPDRACPLFPSSCVTGAAARRQRQWLGASRLWEGVRSPWPQLLGLENLECARGDTCCCRERCPGWPGPAAGRQGASEAVLLAEW